MEKEIVMYWHARPDSTDPEIAQYFSSEFGVSILFFRIFICFRKFIFVYFSFFFVIFIFVSDFFPRLFKLFFQINITVDMVFYLREKYPIFIEELKVLKNSSGLLGPRQNKFYEKMIKYINKEGQNLKFAKLFSIARELADRYKSEKSRNHIFSDQYTFQAWFQKFIKRSEVQSEISVNLPPEFLCTITPPKCRVWAQIKNIAKTEEQPPKRQKIISDSPPAMEKVFDPKKQEDQNCSPFVGSDREDEEFNILDGLVAEPENDGKESTYSKNSTIDFILSPRNSPGTQDVTYPSCAQEIPSSEMEMSPMEPEIPEIVIPPIPEMPDIPEVPLQEPEFPDQDLSAEIPPSEASTQETAPTQETDVPLRAPESPQIEPTQIPNGPNTSRAECILKMQRVNHSLKKIDFQIYKLHLENIITLMEGLTDDVMSPVKTFRIHLDFAKRQSDEKYLTQLETFATYNPNLI